MNKTTNRIIPALIYELRMNWNSLLLSGVEHSRKFSINTPIFHFEGKKDRDMSCTWAIAACLNHVTEGIYVRYPIQKDTCEGKCVDPLT